MRKKKLQGLPKVTQQIKMKVIFKYSTDSLLPTSALLNKHFSKVDLLYLGGSIMQWLKVWALKSDRPRLESWCICFRAM